jgi:hypothetical protein
MGCFLLGFVCSVATCIAYFALFYPHDFRTHLSGDKLKATLEVVSLLSAGYAVTMIVFSLCLGSFSYLIYRLFGSNQDFDRHFAAVLHLRNLEPVAAIAITLFLLQPDSGHRYSWLYAYKHPPWAVVVFTLFVTTRLYYLILGWKALRRVHAGIRRNRLAFLLGFLPVEVAGALGFILFTLVLSYVMVIGLD